MRPHGTSDSCVPSVTASENDRYLPLVTEP